MQDKLLLVEGADDKWFFTAFLETEGLSVEVYPPSESESGIDGNGIDNLLASLPILLKQLSNGQRSKLGVVIDADWTYSGYGFNLRRQQVSEIFAEYGYTSIYNANSVLEGELFAHNQGLAPVGLWIMPNHQQDGMLEDLLLPCIQVAERRVVLDSVVNGLADLKANEDLANILFSPNHESKVKLATWLMWQKKPNQCRTLSPACAFKQGWLNQDTNEINALGSWLRRVFQ